MAENIQIQGKEKDLQYYLSKFYRRLCRHIIEYQILKRYTPKEMGEIWSMVAWKTGLPEDSLLGLEPKDHVEKGCLITLKAEFELFFSIYCKFVLTYLIRLAAVKGEIPDKHRGLVNCISDKKAFFDAFVQQGFRGGHDIFIKQAIPDYGMERMVSLLGTCGWKLNEIIPEHEIATVGGAGQDGSVMDVDPLDQIMMAFQVRHTIEHNFSKVGASFTQKCRPYFNHTTWRRQFPNEESFVVGTRILIDETDIMTTAASMRFVSERLVRHYFETAS